MIDFSSVLIDGLRFPLKPCQILVGKLYCNGALAYRRGNALDRTVAHVASHEDAWHAGLKQEGLSFFLPTVGKLALGAKIGAGQHKTILVAKNVFRQPI